MKINCQSISVAKLNYCHIKKEYGSLCQHSATVLLTDNDLPKQSKIDMNVSHLVGPHMSSKSRLRMKDWNRKIS